MQNNLPSFRAQ